MSRFGDALVVVWVCDVLVGVDCQADVIVWDYEKKERYATFKLHKVKVEALAFSPSDLFLVTLGGRDDNR